MFWMWCSQGGDYQELCIIKCNVRYFDVSDKLIFSIFRVENMLHLQLARSKQQAELVMEISCFGRICSPNERNIYGVAYL
jgi:hypothetical protein